MLAFQFPTCALLAGALLVPIAALPARPRR